MSKPNRMFNKKQLSLRTISTYEILAAYFTDTYYNFIYAAGMQLKHENKVVSVSEGYMYALSQYTAVLDYTNSKYIYKKYEKLLKEIYAFFVEWTSYKTISLTECIDKIVMEFVPEDYFPVMNKEQKRHVIRDVITYCINEFTNVIAKQYFSMIIDNHEDDDNIKVIKEKFFDILLVKREELYIKFIDKPSNNKMDRQMLEKMRHEIESLHNENKKLITLIESKDSMITTRETQLKQLISRIKTTENELSKYKELCNTLQNIQHNSQNTLQSNQQNIARIPYIQNRYNNSVSWDEETPELKTENIESFRPIKQKMDNKQTTTAQKLHKPVPVKEIPKPVPVKEIPKPEPVKEIPKPVPVKEIPKPEPVKVNEELVEDIVEENQDDNDEVNEESDNENEDYENVEESENDGDSNLDKILFEGFEM